MLQHMEDAETDELDEEFVDEVVTAVKSIYSQLPLKYIGSSTMKGVAFVKFLQDVVERMNKSETSSLLSIPSEYESVIKFVAQEATKEAVEIYKERMDVLVNDEGKLPMLWEEFGQLHDECMSEVNKLFFEKIIGSPAQMEGYIQQLNEHISKAKEGFVKLNSEELMAYNENVAKDFWTRFVKIGLTQDNLFGSTEEFQEALRSFELAYEKSMMKSPEAAKVIASYMQNQYPTAIEYMTQLGRMNAELANAMRAKEDAERLRLEALAREEEFRREIEAQKHEREEVERNFREKMFELQSNIEQQQRSADEMKQRLIEEREEITEKYNRDLEEMKDHLREQQRESEENQARLMEEQERKFEQMKNSIEEDNRRKNEELIRKLEEDKRKQLDQQNKFYQEKIAKQIADSQRQTNELLAQLKKEKERPIVVEKKGICVIS